MREWRPVSAHPCGTPVAPCTLWLRLGDTCLWVTVRGQVPYVGERLSLSWPGLSQYLQVSLLE